MKKILSLSLFLCLLPAVIPAKAHAVDINLGVYSFYAIWKPSFEDKVKNYKSDPLFMWGPYISFTFLDKINLSIMYIDTFTKPANTSYSFDGTHPAYGYCKIDAESKVERSDLDITFGLKSSERVNWFIGAKLSSYGSEEPGTLAIDEEVSGISFNLTDTSFNLSMITSLGYAIGFSYTLPLFDYLYLSFTTSLLYTRAEMYSPTELTLTGTDISTYNADIPDENDAIGNNSSLTLSYYISPLSTSVMLGGRFQVLNYLEEERAESVENDYFYGITLAAVLHL